MKSYYPVPRHSNQAVLWWLAAALFLANLIMALQVVGQPVLAELEHPSIFSIHRSLPQALPVPEPPQSQQAAASHVSVTPIPPVAQLRPAPQPVPTPPPGQ